MSGSAGGDAHGGHEVDLLGAERVQAPVGDVLERRTLVRRHLLAEGEHLAAVGVARADGPAVAVGVGARLGGGEAQAARLERLGQEGAHGRDLARRSPPPRRARAPITLRRSAQWPDQEAGVDAEAAVQRVEVLGEGGPVPRDALLQGGQGHALDLGHHPADVVGVLGVDRREGEPAVAADHGRHAVHVRGRGERVPEELRVVVRVRVDHPGCHDEAGGVELRASPARRPADGDDAAVADPDVGQTAGAPRCRR